MAWTWERIRAVSDPGSIERGRGYAAASLVHLRRTNSDGIFADVSGSVEYAVWLGGAQWSCTCPVGVTGAFCKHCVVVAIVAGETGDGATDATTTTMGETGANEGPTHARAGFTSVTGDADQAGAPDQATVPRVPSLELATHAVASLRTRAHLDYWRSMDYAREASDAVDTLEAHVAADGEDAVRLVERAFTTLCGVMGRADDSAGTVGDVAARVLELHATVCRLQPPRPARLVAWLLREQFDGDGWFAPDVVDYAEALGVRGIDRYRKAVETRDPRPQRYGGDDFELRRALQRLAVLDRDPDQVVATHGGDLSAGYHYAAVTAALGEIGRPDLALAHAMRGLDTVGDDPRRSLIAYATRRLFADGDTETALALRRRELQRSPTLARWFDLRTQAEEAAAWEQERDDALAVLAARNPTDLVSAHLAEGNLDAAWRRTTSCR